MKTYAKLVESNSAHSKGKDSGGVRNEVVEEAESIRNNNYTVR